MKTYEEAFNKLPSDALCKGWATYKDAEIECLFMTAELKSKINGTNWDEIFFNIRKCLGKIGVFEMGASINGMNLSALNDWRVYAIWRNLALTCEVCGTKDDSVVMYGAQLVHCDLCAKKWLHGMPHDDITYEKWCEAERERLMDDGNRRQHEAQREQIRTCGNAVANAKETCRVNWHLTDRVAQEAYKGKTILCHLCEKPAVSQDATTFMMDELLCQEHFDLWVKEDRDNKESEYDSGHDWLEKRMKRMIAGAIKAAYEKKTTGVLVGKLFVTESIADQIMDSVKNSRRASSRLEDEISSAEYAQSCLTESSRQLDEKTKALPRLRSNFVDASYAAQRREVELANLLVEIRKAVQRTLAEWPKCKWCNEDWVIRELSLVGKTIGLGHACLMAPEKESKVQTREVKYEFSPEMQRKLKEYQIG